MLVTVVCDCFRAPATNNHEFCLQAFVAGNPRSSKTTTNVNFSDLSNYLTVSHFPLSTSDNRNNEKLLPRTAYAYHHHLSQASASP